MEKRKFPRKASTAPVEFTIEGRQCRRHMGNISPGGMLIRTHEHFEPGTILALRYSPAEDLHIKTKGMVVHSGESGLGVEFFMDRTTGGA